MGVPLDTIEVLDAGDFEVFEAELGNLELTVAESGFVEAIEIEGDVTPEEPAEAFAVPLGEMNFIDVMGDSTEAELTEGIEIKMERVVGDFLQAKEQAATLATPDRFVDDFFASLNDADDDESDDSWLLEAAIIGNPFRLFS